MSLFEKLKTKSANKRLERNMENTYLEVLHMFADVKEKVGRKITSINEAESLLNSYRDNANKALDQVKESNSEIFNKFQPKFEKLFAEIEKYINGLSKTL